MNAPTSSVSAFPAPRVMPNAVNAFGGVLRLTVRRHFTVGHMLVLAGMLVLLVLFSFPAAPSREAATHGLIPWAGRFYVCFLAPILAFIAAAGVMRDDLQADAVDYIFTRPVRRSVYVLFRYVAHVACAQIDFLIALVAVLGIGVYREVPELWAAVPRLLLAQALVITAFSAFGFLCGMLTSRYVIVGLLYGAIIEVGVGNVPTQLNQLSMIRQVLGVLRPIVGGDEGVGGAALASTFSTPTTIALLLAFAVAMLAATAAVFTMKELAGASGRDA